MRTVRIITTKGRSNFTIETSAETWGELQKDLTANGVDFSNMKAIVGETNTTLDLKEAVLPKGLEINGKITNDFVLYLAATKMKAGVGVDVSSFSYKQLKEFIKKNGGASVFGNYTQMTTAKLRQKVAKYQKENGTSVVTESCASTCTNHVEALEAIITTAQAALGKKATVKADNYQDRLAEIERNLNH